ncbi:MAG: hypothetical protein ACRD41_05820 [Candidatus Acidiferrales bacterium]
MKLLSNMLTGKDNATYDIARVSGLLGVLTFLGLEIFQVVHASHLQPAQAAIFDMQTFGIGLGLVITAMATALKIKETTEPGA